MTDCQTEEMREIVRRNGEGYEKGFEAILKAVYFNLHVECIYLRRRLCHRAAHEEEVR